MRMFLVCMTDIFLILYLTAIASAPTKSVLTVEDFYTLKTMHEQLQQDKLKDKEKFEAELSRIKEDKESTSTEKQKKIDELEKSLIISQAEQEKIAKDLVMKEKMLKEREALLNQLNEQIDTKEKSFKELRVTLLEEIQDQEKTAEVSQQLVERFQQEAQEAQRLATQMHEEAQLAYKTAATAKEVEQKALILKDEALKEKAEALAARNQAETEKHHALQAANEATRKKVVAEQEAQQLVKALEDITQDAETAYSSNVRPQLQIIHVKYEREVSGRDTTFNRELSLLPIKIDGQSYVILPSQQIDFTRRSDKAPDKLEITYQDKKITQGWINTEANLLALKLPEGIKDVSIPYPPETQIDTLMPTLLALRNQGNRSLLNKIRGVSDEYFIVNRDYLEKNEAGAIVYDVKGFRGTGTHGEQILRGDQLVDLNGRFIGVANNNNNIIRIDTLKEWEERNFDAVSPSK